uniref:Uncharacterized protein n=1 Tax=Haemonchus contortus TaxID=6289 RepID=A0A7I5E5U5_HAECO
MMCFMFSEDDLSNPFQAYCVKRVRELELMSIIYATPIMFRAPRSGTECMSRRFSALFSTTMVHGQSLQTSGLPNSPCIAKHERMAFAIIWTCTKKATESTGKEDY